MKISDEVSEALADLRFFLEGHIDDDLVYEEGILLIGYVEGAIFESGED